MWGAVAVNLVDFQKIRGVIFRQLIQLSKLEKGRKKTACSDLNRLLLHPPRTCYWHRVASKGAVRGGPGERLIAKNTGKETTLKNFASVP